MFEIFTGRDVIIGRTELGNIPLVSHQNTDNGVVKYIKKLNDRHIFDYRYTIYLADRGVFYASTQFENFHIGTRVKALVFKDKNKISKEIRLFFVSTINKLQTLFKDYLINATNKLPDLKITLPADSKGNLAVDFMENAIKAIQKEAIKSVVLYEDFKINATKEAIKKH
ncbi:restriction endonuclease subunit S [Helicobacter ibis]|uniref:Restriction endonuclease subunit S n=1 Tax=Helicobacter ibis TaxID=2962633 RepID=A0ABT4VDG4_9HELI|nr:restriction endonuclease subunit S [Helicobacter ibis]MDA3968652.1 restriction endonuclease subunit S [Helicobacter ibis]